MSRKDPRFTSRKLILPSALASIFALTSAPGSAQAQQGGLKNNASAVQYYDLKAGPLEETLDAIASTTGRAVVFDRAALKGGRAKPVHGNFSAGAAVSQAIGGTNYVLNEDHVGTLVVTKAITVEILARRDQAETEFKADRSDTATRSGTSLHLVPGSVTLITSKVIESQQLTDVTDALRNVSGMQFKRTPQDATTFGIRGFSASADTNGTTDSHAATRGVFSVERIEVLKGPQAVLSGGDSLGGSVNIVVKKPQAETIRDVTVQYGSFGDKVAAVDLSGALSNDKRLSYRTVASVEHASDSENSLDGRKNKSFMQALRWKDQRTDVIVTGDFTKDFVPLGAYTFARRDGAVLSVPDRLLSSRADGVDAEVKRLGYQFEHRVTDQVVLVSRLQASRQELDVHIPSPGGLTYAAGAANNAPLPNMTFFSSRTRSEDRTLAGDHYLRFTVPTGEVRHKLSVGFNHSNFDLHQYQDSGPTVSVPVYSSTPFTFQDLRDRSPARQYDAHSGSQQRAIYLQDLISYGKWNLLVNWRRNRYAISDSGATYYLTPANQVIATRGKTTFYDTPGLGLVYQLNDATSLYTSYAEGFVPRNDVVCGGAPMAPNLTKNREVGAKFDLLDSRLTVTTSIFSLQQSNALAYDAVKRCYNLRDAQRSRGGEIDVQGRVFPGLDTIFNYTYAQVTDVGVTTTVFPGQPKHKSSLWAVYKFQSANLKGFGAGMGFTASSNSKGSTDVRYPFTVPGGVQFDANVTYAATPWNLTFGVKNIFDRTLYGTAAGASFIPLLAGRTYALTVKRSFQ